MPLKPAPPTLHNLNTDTDTASDLEDLLLKIRPLNRSTQLFLHHLSQLRLSIPPSILREKLAKQHARYQDLESHYGWALASDREQVARVEEKMDAARDGFWRDRGELEDFLRMEGELESVGGILGAFGRVKRELGVALGGMGGGEEMGGF
ncbi:hypothetical protein J1614_000841 [Plenodomus biglobosus]|nr:hypothetical protein J1614_000841 [Plenodomus biglobosus]